MDTEINKKLIAAFEASEFIQKKLPDEEKRKQFLDSLLHAPDYKKEAFIAVITKADRTLNESGEKLLADMLAAQKEIKAIEKDSKKLAVTIEKEQREQSSEDILKNI